MSTQKPLRIGILGAARIADDGIVDPAGHLGHKLVAVAARDRDGTDGFAAARGSPTVHDSCADVIADPAVDVVYNALVNSLHEEWNIAALQAGKHVLSEKPLTSNATQTRRVAQVAAASAGTIVEGFHYLHHPVNHAPAGRRHLRPARQDPTGRHCAGHPRSPDSNPRWSLGIDTAIKRPTRISSPPPCRTVRPPSSGSMTPSPMPS
jgi:hypothetical protein